VSNNWRPPTELPDLRRLDVLSLDVETRDDGLRADRGSAWPWRGGYVVGVSVAYRADGDIRVHYFPLRHPDTNNFDVNQVFAWLRDHVAADVRFVTQNGLYDWGWLRADGDIHMPPANRLDEIGAMATLVDECLPKYGLDALCAWRGLPGKDSTELERAIRTAGLAPKRKKVNAAAHIWQIPARYVGAYAEGDARATLALWENLDPILEREGTRDAYRLEVDLLPMVHEMRRRGIRIDQAGAEQARAIILQKRDDALNTLSEKLGALTGMAEIASSLWKARTFDAHSIDYPRTKKGNPSFRAGKTGWMLGHSHWLPQLIARTTKYDAAANKFLAGHILEHIVNGRVHAEIHPHRSDSGDDDTSHGARSLRFAYSDPPLQQMPARDKELGPLIRSVFLPEPGEVWAKPDISQQEFRFVVHFAVLHNFPGGRAFAERYRSNPDTDCHTLVAEMTGLERGDAKNTNYAKIFGAGAKKFAEMIGKPLAEAKKIYAQYDKNLPFVSRLSMYCQNDALRHGYTLLYDGARRHWNRFEAHGIYAAGAGPCLLEEAKRRIADRGHPWFGATLRRHNVHTALNALIQGSAARHTKLWMRACWREGIVPMLQMHDSLDCSVATRDQGERVARLGCEAVTLKVPMRVDLKFGRNWGDATHSWDELHSTDEGSSVSADTECTTTGAHRARAPKLEAKAQASEAHVPLTELINQPLSANGNIRCPFHADSTPSLHIYPDHFHCFGCDAHGDSVDWLMMIDGMNREDALATLKGANGSRVSPPRNNADKEKEDEARRLLALQLWEQAKPIAGTLAEQYLAGPRRIDIAALPDTVNDVLRFHPRCTFGSRTKHPCLLALMRDVLSNEPCGIHRIALTPQGDKIERRMLGRSGAIKLWLAGPQLVVGEGIETTLAAATRVPYRGALLQPAWAVLSAGALGSLPVIPGVEQLFILVDHDLNGVGQAAAARCAERWSRAGRQVTRLKPKQPGTDFNDLFKEPAP
jgi:Mesyanzhinovviridae DNA polymerase